jgi:hypothetical protein
MKPFWKKKRFLLPLATVLLGLVGVKNPAVVADIGADVVSIVNGHSPD